MDGEVGSLLAICVYGLPAAALLLLHVYRRSRRTRAALEALEASRASGLTEPASLHPLIDPSRCLGCGTCVPACPEGDVLGLVHGRAELINPTQCIGHGACADACPTDAITLVLGTAARGIDIPRLSSDFQTSVPGIFVAGELGGMGLIRNAIEQGRQAVEAIRKLDRAADDAVLDLVIVGAGPAGFSAALTAQQHGLEFVVLEQETLGGTVAHYPRGKIVMTTPVELPLIGKVTFQETSKEQLLEFWLSAQRRARLRIHEGERVEGISRRRRGFEIRTGTRTYASAAVLLAIGRRGTPRKLGVPGEELDKVVYRLVDPEQYRGQPVLVVGGGDSALEAAASLAGVPGTSATLSYRGAAFQRAKPRNRERVEAAAKSGRLTVWLESTIQEITTGTVRVQTSHGAREIANDSVIVCAGGILPTAFLESIGVDLETCNGTPIRCDA